MKTYLLLATCLIVSGCGQEQNNREVLGKLADIKSELETRRADAVRWAFANKREIDFAVFQWSRDKMEEVAKSEALPPETEQKVRQYEALQTQLIHKEMELRGVMLRSEPSTSGETYEALSNRVAAARAPIADIIARRGRQESEYRSRFSAEKLIAEYVQGRFDLVVDSSDEHISRSAVLYRTNGEVLDITEGVLQLFKEKTKP
jgi:hypothetical protein